MRTQISTLQLCSSGALRLCLRDSHGRQSLRRLCMKSTRRPCITHSHVPLDLHWITQSCSTPFPNRFDLFEPSPHHPYLAGCSSLLRVSRLCSSPRASGGKAKLPAHGVSGAGRHGRGRSTDNDPCRCLVHGSDSREGEGSGSTPPWGRLSMKPRP